MLAVTETSNLQAVERPRPTPGPGEVLIRVDFAGMNPVDLGQLDGKYPAPEGASDILGVEVSGRRVDNGDRVMALVTSGAYGQYVAVPENMVMLVPDGLSQEQAAAVPESLATAWSNLVDALRVQPGETVLIQGGSGSLGSFAIQLARELGATVLATAGGSERCARVEELGAFAVDHRGDDIVARVKERAENGVDAVMNIMGSDVGEMLKVLNRRGRMCVISLQGGTRSDVPVGLLMVKHLSLIGTTLRSRSDEEKSAIVRAAAEFALPRLNDGSIVPIVARVFPLSRVAEAVEYLKGGSPFGKVILDMREQA